MSADTVPPLPVDSVAIERDQYAQQMLFDFFSVPEARTALHDDMKTEERKHAAAAADDDDAGCSSGLDDELDLATTLFPHREQAGGRARVRTELEAEVDGDDGQDDWYGDDGDDRSGSPALATYHSRVPIRDHDEPDDDDDQPAQPIKYGREDDTEEDDYFAPEDEDDARSSDGDDAYDDTRSASMSSSATATGFPSLPSADRFARASETKTDAEDEGETSAASAASTSTGNAAARVTDGLALLTVRIVSDFARARQVLCDVREGLGDSIAVQKEACQALGDGRANSSGSSVPDPVHHRVKQVLEQLQGFVSLLDQLQLDLVSSASQYNGRPLAASRPGGARSGIQPPPTSPIVTCWAKSMDKSMAEQSPGESASPQHSIEDLTRLIQAVDIQEEEQVRV